MSQQKQTEQSARAAEDVMEAYKAVQRVKAKIGYVGTPPELWESMCQIARDLLALGPQINAEESRRS